MPDITNWFGDVVTHPKVVVDAASVDDIAKILKNRTKYPSPVRAIGSNHSPGECGPGDGGTVIRMSGMNRILDINKKTVTAQAGAIYIDVAKELQKQKLQFYVNTEIGNLSIGSAACAGTKDASMPGELGQVGSYVSSIKMVLPSGEPLEVTDDQPELMQLVRSSYGLLGIVYEATIRVRPIQPLTVHHETFSLKDFVAKLPRLKTGGDSLMLYIFPFDDAITVEFRRYNPAAKGKPDNHVWPLRNYLWASAGPLMCSRAEADIANPDVRYKVIDGFNGLWRFKLENLVRSKNTVATDQMIRYPSPSDASRYTFSLWAFPEETYGAVLTKYFAFTRKYYKDAGYRINMLNVGYRVAKDQNSLFSYSYDGDVITIDPVSTANRGWPEFLDAYNRFSSDHGGSPLFNQTPRVTTAQVKKALGPRLETFAAARQKYDPAERLLNEYFRKLLA